MYLKRVSISGFKSFANKTVIELEPGITAIVGPNGSGKSNVADAIRWAMGEQSKTRLRLNDREEVVFAGSEKRARASMAEVALVFDNSDGAFALDVGEVEIGRRLYRSGETEYRLAGRVVRLSEIQLLLAQAQVGAGSYAVVGQGMIDSMLLASPAERKLLFDEASGIRGDELKREAAAKRLNQAELNCLRLKDIAAELAPRLVSLERLARAGARRAELEQKLDHDKAVLLATAAYNLGQDRLAVGQQQSDVKVEIEAEARRYQDLKQALRQEQEQSEAAKTRRESLGRTLLELESRRDQLSGAVAIFEIRSREKESIEGSLQDANQRQNELQNAAKQLKRKQATLSRELASMQSALKRSEEELDRLNSPVKQAQEMLLGLRKQASDGTQQQYISHALNAVKVMAQGLSHEEPQIDHLRLLVHKTGRLLSHASRNAESGIMSQLEQAQRALEQAMHAREGLTEHMANLTISVRSLEIDISACDEQEKKLAQEMAADKNIILKLQQQAASLAANLTQEKQDRKRLSDTTAELMEIRRQLTDLDGGSSSKAVQIATELERVRAARVHLASERVKLKSRLTQIDREAERYRRLASDWGENHSEAVPSPKPVSALQDEISRLEVRLEAERSLVQEGEAEYAAVKQRYDDLCTQISDLESAQADLRTVVGRLDDAIKSSFESGFAAISTHFETYFNRLMEGGSATLKLVKSETGGYGIEIKASPKGKRLSSLNALSGGERALTGVALLAAILAANPSPFIVMDEIDAALDEANSRRLAAILKELATSSQLIVITHNRQTMAAAGILFGVTLNQNHVSHLIAMRLEAAAEMAAR